MANSVQRAFDIAAEDYDRARRRLIPGFDDFYRAAIDLLPFERDDEFDVLDLGAGTGLLSALVAYRFPRARIALVDISNEMLAKARERFAMGGARFRFEVSDYTAAPIAGRYRAAVSALSIHHLSDERKRALFGKIYGALEDGGVFVNADQFRAPSDEIERRHHARWLALAREIGVEEADLAQALQRMKYDRAATIEDQLEWMRAAGFREIDCAYRNLIFAVYGGRKRITG
ncbi:MAG: class I SAM-dependent methyltransferase [Candidatus Binataceae bacterium]